MNFAALVASRARLTIGIALIFSAMGLVAWLTMPRMEDPRLPFRAALVVTTFPGADAATMERLIAKPIEERVAEVALVKRIESTIRTDAVITIIELRDEANNDDKVRTSWDEVRRKLAIAKKQFPAGASDPDLDDEMFDTESIVLAVTGSADPVVLYDAAKRMRRELLKLPDVVRVVYQGEPSEQVTVEYDQALAQRLGLDAGQLAQQLGARNTTIPGGSVQTGPQSAKVTPLADFRSVEEIATTPIVLRSGAALPLNELTDIRLSPAEPAGKLARFNGAPAVVLGLIARRDSNMVAFGNEVRDRVAQLNADIAPLRLEEVAYQPSFVKQRLDDLGRSLVQSIGILAVLLFVTMGWRLGLIVSSVVPLVALTSLAMYFLGGGILQQMSVAALVIALGMLVDNAIVMAEAVQWHIDRGATGAQAATNAISELAVPLASATGTTVAAFLPMLLSEGPTGDFTRAIPIVIILTLTLSYVFAVAITPTMAAGLLKPSKLNRLKFLEGLAERFSNLSLRRPVATLVAMALVVTASVALAPLVRQQFFPSGDKPVLLVSVELPEGAHISATDAAARKVERFLQSRPETASIATFVGQGAPHFYYNVTRKPNAPHLSELIVNTKGLEDVAPLRAAVREFARAEMPGVNVTPRKLEQGPPVEAPVAIKLYGENLEALEQSAETVRRAMRETPGAIDIRDTMGLGSPGMRIAIDDAAAARLGIARASVAQALYGQTRGLPAGDYRGGADPMPIVVRSRAGDQTPVEFLESVQVPVPGRSPVPLAQVARITPEWTPASFHHRDGQRVVSVTSQLDEGFTYSDVMRALKPKLAAASFPAGVKWKVGGEAESSGDANASLLKALPLGIAMLLFFLLAEFNSFRRTAIILVTVPLAAAGVLPGLVFSGQPFGFTSMLGVFALIGIVVNNAIVLLEVADTRVREGADVETALRDAVAQRTRPILLTTSTTVIGLLPLAYSPTTLWPPMAWAIISGLTASTMLTLVAVPALYKLLFARKAAPTNPAPFAKAGFATAAVTALAITGLAFALGYAPAAKAQGATQAARPVTFDDVLKLAAQRPAIKAAGYDAEAREAQAATAWRSGYMPSLTASVAGSQLNKARALNTPFGAFVQGGSATLVMQAEARQPILDARTLFWVGPAADKAHDAAVLAAARERQTRIAEAANAFIAVLQIDANRRAIEGYITALEARTRELAVMVDAGRALPTDAAKVQLALDDARLTRTRLANLRDTALADLARTTGTESAGDAGTLEPVWDPSLAARDLPQAGEAVRQAYAQRPDLQAIDANLSAIAKSRDALWAEFIPRLDAIGRVTYLSPSPYEDKAYAEGLVALTWTPFQPLDKWSRADDFDAQAAALRERRIEAARGIALEVRAAVNNHTTARDALPVRKSAVTLAEDTARVERDRLASGRATVNDVLEAEANVRDAQGKLALAELDSFAAWVQYRVAAGFDWAK